MRRLEREGYEVVIAVDGQQGVDLALSTRPDLILMDMSLPIIDGWEATRQLKAREDIERVRREGISELIDRAAGEGPEDGGQSREAA